MEYELPAHLIPIFERHFQAGTTLAQSVIVLEDATGARHSKPGFWARRKANKAVKHLKACLSLLPNYWPAYWFLGKTYQGLYQYPEALASFEQAAALHPHQPDVLREASIAAVDAGNAALAAHYSELALREAPHDIGLMGNHSINLLLNNQDEAALKLIEEALELAPQDIINQQAHRLIKRIAEGVRPRPTCREIAGR